MKGDAGNFVLFNTSACVYSCGVFDKDFDEILVRREGRSQFECCLLEKK